MSGARPVQMGPLYPDYNRQNGYGGGRGHNRSYVDPDRYSNDRYSNDRYAAERRPRRLKPDDVMTFDPKTTDVRFFIRRIRIIVAQEGQRPVLNVLPFCLKGRALTWHTELPEVLQDQMAHEVEVWYDELEREFKRPAIEARQEARQLKFRFKKADDLSLADYLVQKTSLLRAAGTTDEETLKSELWEGLDNNLAYLVQPTENETLEAFKRRLRAAEAGAKRQWQLYNKKKDYAGSKRTDKDQDNRRADGGRADKADPPDTADKAKPSGGRYSSARPSRPCRHCGGDHWNRECDKRDRRVNLMKRRVKLDDDESDAELEGLSEPSSDSDSSQTEN